MPNRDRRYITPFKHINIPPRTAIPPPPSLPPQITRSCHYYINNQRLLLAITAYWDQGEPGSLALKPGWIVNHIEAFDADGNDVTQKYTEKELQRAADYSQICWPVRPGK